MSTSRKSFKHSKRFERTQKGCLTCRQKKKKCDGAKPVCESCSKRGLECKYPENIRIFNVKSLKTSLGSSFIDSTSSFQINMDANSSKRSNSCDHGDHLPKESVRDFSASSRSNSTVSTQYTSAQSSVSPPETSKEHIHQQTPSNRRASIDFNEEEDRENLKMLSQISDVIQSNNRTTNSALSLSRNGESIKQILDNIAIDVIKRSIESLKYIDWEKNSSYTSSISREDNNISNIHSHGVISDMIQPSVFASEGSSSAASTDKDFDQNNDADGSLLQNWSVIMEGLKFKPDDTVPLQSHGQSWLTDVDDFLKVQDHSSI